MSHLDKFIALYKEMGIDLVVEPDTDSTYPRATQAVRLDRDSQLGLDPKYASYGGFFSVIYFDAEGNFVFQGFWE